jgi:uncharacterized Zn-finger protein
MDEVQVEIKEASVDSKDLIYNKMSSQEALYLCTFCSTAFDKPELLGKHVETCLDLQSESEQDRSEDVKNLKSGEKLFSCDVCNKSFNLARNLKRHTWLHTGENPFSCKYCTQKCPDLFNLQNHERSHTGEKPFTCKYCPRKFANTGNLRQKYMKAMKHFHVNIVLLNSGILEI